MPATLRAANAEEISDLIFWLDDHPDEMGPSSRDAVAEWLAEFWRNAEAYPCSGAVPEEAVEVLDAVIEDWTEVLTAHDEEFLTELKRVSME